IFLVPAFLACSPAVAALPEAEMDRLLRDQPLPFEYRCPAPLTRVLRIEDHETARQLERQVDAWPRCLADFSRKLGAYVGMELPEAATPAGGMSTEQRSRYRAALDQRARAALAAIRPQANATAALVNETFRDFNSRIPELGYSEEDFQKIARRFDELEDDRVAPGAIPARVQGIYRE